MLFMVLLAAINLRGVGESVKFNVLLTIVEMTALAIVILIGLYVVGKGDGDLSRITVFENPDDKGLFMAVTVATAIAFFSMVGFEDSVNMVEETQDPMRIFPRTMLTGLGIAVVIYMLVAISVVAVIPPGQIAQPTNAEAGILLDVVKTGTPDLPIDKLFPFLTVFAVANTALINMLMASRLIYGMARQDVLPRSLGKVLPGRRSPWTAILFTTLLALGLIAVVTLQSDNSVVERPVRHHRHPAARGVHGGQHRLPGAAPRPRAGGGLPRPPVPAGRGRGVLRLPARALGAHRGATWSSTRSPAACSPSAWCCGSSPG